MFYSWFLLKLMQMNRLFQDENNPPSRRENEMSGNGMSDVMVTNQLQYDIWGAQAHKIGGSWQNGMFFGPQKKTTIGAKFLSGVGIHMRTSFLWNPFAPDVSWDGRGLFFVAAIGILGAKEKRSLGRRISNAEAGGGGLVLRIASMPSSTVAP